MDKGNTGVVGLICLSCGDKGRRLMDKGNSGGVGLICRGCGDKGQYTGA